MIQRLFFMLAFSVCCKVTVAQQQIIHNPITPGYFADPTIVKDKGSFFIYATIDPWGDKELAVLETKDFITFKRHHLNWPTKQACTTPTSLNEMVWAPSVVKGKDNRFYMYVAVGGEVWGGVSNTPLGPWKNLKSDNSPMVKSTDYKAVHNIDPDCFIDADGSAYLYWGSGYKWINGHCMAVKLKKDMVSFDGAPVEVTTPHFFEGAHMVKRNKVYYLMFSEGKAIDASYQVGYAKGNSPLGPFTEDQHRVILSTSADSTVIGPGHHTTFEEKGQRYILYHRIFPQKESYVLRQLCLDSLNFDAGGNIKRVSTKGVKPFN
ncbi:family 43 glycosylhydrolase [Mucilaginibacter flavus]|uniref:family 43 glycosylhydrolase n=1 Tax=Mucilaginibacter flavus TaxID=931504 RepID=UPI0025B3C0B5|nr:family 43 glycosylhydrolase [Mucilaginibacter flavus]MDN3582414.1 family 43 glycosylhydrolase [Mucilaginibacter flavus]